MNRTTRYLTRLTGLAATILGLVLVTAAQASAMRPDPGPGGPASRYQGSDTPSVLRVTDSSVSAQQWVLIAAAVIGALLIGAALMRLAQRHHAQPAH